jgi:hypothetical protein
MADSAMEKDVAKVDDEIAASGSFVQRHAGTADEAAGAADRGQSAIDREQRQRGWLKKPRESLHAWIVHFDAEPSSGPPESNDED